MKKYENYAANLKVLSSAKNEDLSNEFIISGIIDKFFIQFELGWKLLKELMKYEGNSQAASGSPRAIIKEAYASYSFLDETLWLSMLEARNDMTHIYKDVYKRQGFGSTGNCRGIVFYNPYSDNGGFSAGSRHTVQ